MREGFFRWLRRFVSGFRGKRKSNHYPSAYIFPRGVSIFPTHLSDILGIVRSGMERIGVYGGLIVGAGLHPRVHTLARGCCVRAILTEGKNPPGPLAP